MFALSVLCLSFLLTLDGLAGPPAMRSEGACGGEFAQFVPNHVFGNVDLEEGSAVVYHEVVADEFGDNGACPAPGADGFVPALFALGKHFPHQLDINVRAFSYRTRHIPLRILLALAVPLSYYMLVAPIQLLGNLYL